MSVPDHLSFIRYSHIRCLQQQCSSSAPRDQDGDDLFSLPSFSKTNPCWFVVCNILLRRRLAARGSKIKIQYSTLRNVMHGPASDSPDPPFLTCLCCDARTAPQTSAFPIRPIELNTRHVTPPLHVVTSLSISPDLIRFGARRWRVIAHRTDADAFDRRWSNWARRV